MVALDTMKIQVYSFLGFAARSVTCWERFNGKFFVIGFYEIPFSSKCLYQRLCNVGRIYFEQRMKQILPEGVTRCILKFGV